MNPSNQDGSNQSSVNQGNLNQSYYKQYLIIGGTGMLAPLCQWLPADELIVAARFLSNKKSINNLPDEIMRVQLDYYDKKSKQEFMTQLATWTQLQAVILWVHSPAHAFSHQVIDTVAGFEHPPTIIHVFGTQMDDSTIANHASTLNVNYHAVKLGKVTHETGWRWMTHDEISQQVFDVLKVLK